MTRSLQQVPIQWTLAPHSDEDTSREAAKAIVPHIARLEARVLHFVAMQGDWGATAEEIEHGTELGGSTVRPRLVALRARGFVVKTAQRRETKSGRLAAVWKAI